MTFREVLENLIAERGQGNLALELGIDQSLLSRFRSGKGALSLEQIERVCENAEVVIQARTQYLQEQREHMIEASRLKNALATICQLWEQERPKNSRMTDPGNGGLMTE